MSTRRAPSWGGGVWVHMLPPHSMCPILFLFPTSIDTAYGYILAYGYPDTRKILFSRYEYKDEYSRDMLDT